MAQARLTSLVAVVKLISTGIHVTHTIAPTTLAAAGAPLTIPVYLVALYFRDGPLFLHSRLGEILLGGDLYTGFGDLGDIAGIAEVAEASRSTFTLSLRGVPNDLIALALGDAYQGRPCVVREGRIDPATYDLLPDPWVLRRGLMDTMDMEQGETASITLSVESEFSQWDRPVARRYTDADQQSRYPGDPFFQYAEQSVTKTLYWGQVNK